MNSPFLRSSAVRGSNQVQGFFLQCPSIAMSESKGAQPLTPQEKEVLQSLLARDGIHHEEGEPPTPSDFSLVDLQSMSDASKR